MKIIVNDQIIDTENIFSISEVKEGATLNFEINFFNGKSMDVEVNNYLSTDEFTSIKSIQNIVERNSAFEKLNADRIEKFKKTWSELVNIWSNNQTKIPRFNF